MGFARYLSGERTPHNDAQVHGGFSGFSTGTTQQDLTHAVLAVVCFGLRHGFEAITGTGAASRYWLRMLATVLNTPLHLPERREFGAALGAACLAMAAPTCAPVEEIMSPRRSRGDYARYDAAFAQFRKLYPAFKLLSS